MKAIRINEFADDMQHVVPTDIPVPHPGPTEYLVKVVAAGVNYVDQLYVSRSILPPGTNTEKLTQYQIKGKHQNNRHSVRPPFTLGLEFSGVILRAPSVSALSVGDRVFGACTGAYSEYVVISSGSMIRKIPAGLTFEQAAVLAGTFPVAYKALVFQNAIKAGDTVLIHTAAGGLGIAAVQIAANMGCRVLGTASTREKCAYAEEFGAEVCMETGQGNWWDRVLDLTDGRGVDFVFDPAGMVTPSLRCLVQGGQILVVGFVATQDTLERVSMGRALMKEATIKGYVSSDAYHTLTIVLLLCMALTDFLRSCSANPSKATQKRTTSSGRHCRH